jgi:hypothetical protein
LSRGQHPLEFLTKKTTFTNRLLKKTTYKKNCQKRPLLAYAAIARAGMYLSDSGQWRQVHAGFANGGM